jgi:hypothetical protein
MIQKFLNVLFANPDSDFTQKAAQRDLESAILYFENRTEDIIIKSNHEKDRDEINRYHYAVHMVELHNRKGVEVFKCFYQDEKNSLEEWSDYEDRWSRFRLEKMKARIHWAANDDLEGYYEWGRDLIALFKQLQKEQVAKDFAKSKYAQKSHR